MKKIEKMYCEYDEKSEIKTNFNTFGKFLASFKNIANEIDASG
jgi:hypothetical protein